jgi:hypothetical protein
MPSVYVHKVIVRLKGTPYSSPRDAHSVSWLRPRTLPRSEPRVPVSGLNVVDALFSASVVCVSVNLLVVTASVCERQRDGANCACSVQHKMQSFSAGNSMFRLVVRPVAALGSEPALRRRGIYYLLYNAPHSSL